MDRLSNVLEPAQAAKREYNTMQREAPDNIPYPTISGPTADSVNAASAQQQPSTISEFYGRGGLSNTAKQMQNAVAQKQQKRELKAQYERFLEAGEKGADALFQDAISQFGQGITEWIPPKDFYYDEDGIFMPHKYAQAVYLGIQKFKESEKNKQANIQAGTIIGGATNPQEATAGILQSGQSYDPYKEAVKNVPTLQDQATTENTLATANKTDVEAGLLPIKTAAEINKANAGATKDRTSGDQRKLRGQDIPSLRAKRAEIEKIIELKRKDLRDPIKSVRMTPAEKDEIQAEIDNQRAQQMEIDQEIDQARKNEGMQPAPQPDKASEKARAGAANIISGMQQSPPKKYETVTGPTGAQSLQEKGWFADKTPNSELYNKELSSRVIQFAMENGWPQNAQIDPGMIAEELKTSSLEDVIDGILKAIERSKQQVPTNPAETIQ